MVPVGQKTHGCFNSRWICSRSEMRIMENGDRAAGDRPTYPCLIVAVDEIVTGCGCVRGIVPVVHRPDHFAVGRVTVDMDRTSSCSEIRFMEDRKSVV